MGHIIIYFFIHNLLSRQYLANNDEMEFGHGQTTLDDLSTTNKQHHQPQLTNKEIEEIAYLRTLSLLLPN